MLKHISLLGDYSGNIKQLSGFKKHSHRVPDDCNDATRNFVMRIGAEEVSARGSNVYTEIRNAFSFKRRDLHLSIDGSSAAIESPDFDVNISLEQDEDDHTSYLLRTEVTSVRRPAVVLENEFIAVFSHYCDTVTVYFSKPVNIDNLIDNIEDIPEFSKQLEYEPDGSELTLSLSKQKITIRICSERMDIKLSGGKDLKRLIESASLAIDQLVGSGISTLIPIL